MISNLCEEENLNSAPYCSASESPLSICTINAAHYKDSETCAAHFQDCANFQIVWNINILIEQCKKFVRFASFLTQHARFQNAFCRLCLNFYCFGSSNNTKTHCVLCHPLSIVANCKTLPNDVMVVLCQAYLYHRCYCSQFTDILEAY